MRAAATSLPRLGITSGASTSSRLTSVAASVVTGATVKA